MSVLDLARVVIYRFHEKGLEVFLVNSDLENDPDIWKLPKAQAIKIKADNHYVDLIELEPSEDERGNSIIAIAIEGDWHDMPSIRGMLKHDVKLVKETIKEMVPGIEKGAYFAVKEAFRKVMPDEYKALKELKDVLLDRNLVKNM